MPAFTGLRFLGRSLGSRYNPLLAQVVVTRRCNLACGYCNEYDVLAAGAAAAAAGLD